MGNWQGFRTELGEVWIDALNNGPMKVKAINTDSWPKKESQPAQDNKPCSTVAKSLLHSLTSPPWPVHCADAPNAANKE
jgi:hypothetical protein